MIDIIRLRFVADSIAEKAPVGNLPHVDLADVESAATGRWNTAPVSHRETEALVLRAGDVAYARLRPYLRKTFLADRAMTASTEFLVLRIRSGWHPAFLSYCLRDRTFAERVTALVEGAKMPRAPWEMVRNIPIGSPRFERQKEIVHFLDHECDRIDALSFELTNYTRRLTSPALEEFRHLIQGIATGRIGYRFEVQLGKMLDDRRVDPNDLSPYLRNANVHWDRLELSDVKSMTFGSGDRRKFALRPGDVLVCEGGEPGRAAVWNGEIPGCYYQKALHRLRAFGADSPRFLLWCLRDLSARGAFGSDGPGRYTHLTAEQLRAVRIPLPAPSEQRRIAEVVDRRATYATRVSEEVDGLRLDLHEYRDALITEAVTGKLDIDRVSDQQLDESARAVAGASRPEVFPA